MSHVHTGHGETPDNHHPDAHDMAKMITREFWDERYSSTGAIWSGNPNPQLVEHATDLAPGTALDIGSGEGADAIWLASRGWQVTGLDISAVALDRAAQRALAAGKEIADRVSWQRADLLSWRPSTGDAAFQFDLVSAHFMHLPRPALQSVHRQLAAAVRPAGTLLIVGHHPSDLDTSMGRPNVPDMFYTAEEIASALDPLEWQIVVAAAPERQVPDPDGRVVTIRDAVLKAVRRR